MLVHVSYVQATQNISNITLPSLADVLYDISFLITRQLSLSSFMYYDV